MARSADASIVDHGSAGVLLSSPQALQDVAVAVEGMLHADRSNGYPPSARLVELVDVLRRRLADAVDFRARNPEVPAPLNPPEWVEPAEGLTAAQAARLLSVGERQVRNLAAAGQLPAVRVGGRWRINPAAVAEAARDRRTA